MDDELMFAVLDLDGGSADVAPIEFEAKSAILVRMRHSPKLDENRLLSARSNQDRLRLFTIGDAGEIRQREDRRIALRSRVDCSRRSGQENLRRSRDHQIRRRRQTLDSKASCVVTERRVRHFD